MDSTLVAVLTISAGVFGVYFGDFLAERRSRKDDVAKMRMSAYVDFIRLATELSAVRRMGHAETDLVLMASLNEAKARVCMCADKAVVARLESFWLEGGTLEREQEILAFTRMCGAMRKSIGQEDLGFDINLSGILFKLEPSSYTYRKRLLDPTTPSSPDDAIKDAQSSRAGSIDADRAETRFDEADRAKVVKALEDHYRTRLTPIAGFRKSLKSVQGERFWVLGGYGGWHGIKPEMIDELLQGQFQGKLVVAKMEPSKIVVYETPLSSFIEYRDKLVRTQVGDYHFNLEFHDSYALVREIPEINLIRLLDVRR